jgi:type-F conjugative transfer system pilin assembly protein TrbC
MLKCFTSLVTFSSLFLFSSIDPEWLKQAETNISKEEYSWVDERAPSIDVDFSEKKTFLDFLSKECSSCKNTHLLNENKNTLFIFISFSMPDDLILSLSKEVERFGNGVFVLRGIPKNSFNTFISKVHSLRKRGVTADIQVNPKKFKEYSIDLVPSFVLEKEGKFDLITGNISLKYALEKFSKEGDTVG